MHVIDRVDLTAPGVRAGNHAIWIPPLDGDGKGVKIPFQFGGRICKLSRPGEPDYPLDSLAHEVAILRALAERQMAPPVGNWVYVKEVVSTYPRASASASTSVHAGAGAWWSDPVGAYGYEISDAASLPPGRFDIDAMRALPIQGSEGAWNDIGVPDRNNVVNGYLVDVRRTAWDMLRWVGPDLPALPDHREDPARIEAWVRRDCQFPAGERPEPYQDFYLGGRWIAGSRRVVERAQALGFLPAPGESVLDIGCQSGGFLQYAHLCASASGAERAGSSVLAGVDIVHDYIDCAREIARHERMNICYREADATDALDRDGLCAWARDLFPGGRPDHLLLLAMDKHLGERGLWTLVDQIQARRTYLETNAQREGVYALRAEVERRGGRYLGDSTDRNVRRLYVIS